MRFSNLPAVMRSVLLATAACALAAIPLTVDAEATVGDEPEAEPESASSTEPPDQPPQSSEAEEQIGDPAFERKLAELAFALYLGSELDVDAGSYSCTEPPTLEVGEIVTCFTLIGDERVIVAEAVLSGTSGVYEFEVISDFSVDSGEPTPSTSTTVATTTTQLPVPFIVTTIAPLSAADEALLAYAARINQSSEDFAENVISSGQGVVSAVDYEWNEPTAQVEISVTLDTSYESDAVDVAAFVVARGQALELWARESPFRAEGTTIRPSLLVAVNDVSYVSDYDLCVSLADQTISMDDWIGRSRQ